VRVVAVGQAVRILGAVILCAPLAWAPAAHAAAMATLDLGSAAVVGQTARLELFLEFASGNAADRIEVIEPSVWGSDPLLTSNNTNFGRFSFSLDTGELTSPLWQELDPLGAGTWPWLGMYEAPLGDPGIARRPGNPYHVGTLQVNLAGLPADQSVFVTLAGGTIPDTNTELAGFIEGVLGQTFADGTNNDDTDPAWLLFADPSGVFFRTPGAGPPPDIIPEPLTLTTALLSLAGVLFRRRRP